REVRWILVITKADEVPRLGPGEGWPEVVRVAEQSTEDPQGRVKEAGQAITEHSDRGPCRGEKGEVRRTHRVALVVGGLGIVRGNGDTIEELAGVGNWACCCCPCCEQKSGRNQCAPGVFHRCTVGAKAGSRSEFPVYGPQPACLFSAQVGLCLVAKRVPTA